VGAPSARPVETRIAEPLVRHPFPVVPTGIDGLESRLLLESRTDKARAQAYDAYRILRTKLRQSALTHGWSRFGVTSAGQGDGKSTTAANLALSSAREARQNVFLLDLDLRRPSLLRYFGVRTPPVSIAHFLERGGEPGTLFFSPGVDCLYMAGSVQRCENSAELLSNGRLDDMLQYIAGIDPHALVIVDLPPVLSTADVLTVAPRLSALLIVASEGFTRREDLANAVVTIGETATPVAGIVLNRATEANQGAYVYY
jgi:Mrp family chromosome partitioning ATPase